jgi:hypothetical protein
MWLVELKTSVIGRNLMTVIIEVGVLGWPVREHQKFERQREVDVRGRAPPATSITITKDLKQSVFVPSETT